MSSSSADMPIDEDDWTDAEDNLEQAYLRALEANDAVEWEFHQLPTANGGQEGAAPESVQPTSDPMGVATAPADAGQRSRVPAADEPGVSRVTPSQVIEAALFVGGQPLTAKKLCYVLRGDYDLDFVEQTIDDLNHQYQQEARPYEIRLGEGGYRLVLHEEFQRLRNRVYGVGPREVKLSQDALEVLALVAYHQPLTVEQIEQLGKSNPGPVLRQLLRRELLVLERDPQDRKQVKYRTSRRFLSVFGIGSLDELPQADELSFK